MKNFVRFIVWITVLGCTAITAASDHADPMSLNAFMPQDQPLANITDLHAFVVDRDGTPIRNIKDMSRADQLIVSLCVRRRLLFWQIDDPALERGLPELSFRIHLDLDSEVTHYDPNKFTDGRNYTEALKKLDERIDKAQVEHDPQLESALTERARLIGGHQLDARMEALYGGTIVSPQGIAEDALLDFRLRLNRKDENISVQLHQVVIDGINGTVNQMSGDSVRVSDSSLVPTSSSAGNAWRPEAINIKTGIFDDPFIFPRFFRSNVIGIVTSIPLSLLRLPDGSPAAGHTILLWATTHEKGGRQVDHVGRSVRTQLPRFGDLNLLHPSQHVASILRRHSHPTLLESSLATFIAPLEAHRFYDAVPDVMVYDLSRPAAFPNGRWLEDDVAKTLADAGEPLLYELSLTESKQFPRATTNDKPFKLNFPYLADPWTKQETNAYKAAGTRLGDFMLPYASDAGATALPDFPLEVWKSIWWGLVAGLLVTGFFLLLLLRGLASRLAVIAVALVSLCALMPIRAPVLDSMARGFMSQPFDRLNRSLAGSGIVVALGLVALYSTGVRRGIAYHSTRWLHWDRLDREGETSDDRQYAGSTFEQVRDCIFENPYYSPNPWGTRGTVLPIYRVPLTTLMKGLWLGSKTYPLREASLRTITSHADLRPGKDGRGFPRLLHPHGVCLTGIWRITQDTDYTGYFATGKQCLIIGRYSSEERLRDKPRSLSLLGKLFPTLDRSQTVRTASFITQSALGGARSDSIFGVTLRNAPDIHPFSSFKGFLRLLLSLIAFKGVDIHRTERQLYEIAEAGEDTEAKGWKTRCPRYMQLTVKSPATSSDSSTDDFRDDVMTQIYDRGSFDARRTLVFKIEVSETGVVQGWLNKTLVGATWNEIGEIEFTDAVASYNGDFVLHFHHPQWRNDQNNPASVARLENPS